jgi:predicted nucleic acid-binding protein
VSDEHLVVDASALIDLVLGEPLGEAVRARIDDVVLHAPAHVDAEVLSGLGRMHRAGRLTVPVVMEQLEAIAAAPIDRHPLPALLAGTWARRDRLRLADALYVELADRLGVRLLTTDRALARATKIAEVVTP